MFFAGSVGLNVSANGKNRVSVGVRENVVEGGGQKPMEWACDEIRESWFFFILRLLELGSLGGI